VKVKACIEVQGEVWRVPNDSDAVKLSSQYRTCVTNDCKLFIEGRHVGTALMGTMRPDVEYIYEMSQMEPVGMIVQHTTIDCILDFPSVVSSEA
jgi:hypothetical protein